MPAKLNNIPHDNDCTHTYLEIKIKDKWKILDATWDKGLKKILPVNEWDGKSDTKIAVKPIMIFGPKKSLRIVKRQDKALINKDLKVNGEFYKGLNDWLEILRK